ncbi:hypothetical protein [Marinobacterium sp. BA1]|uniref:hypothetical protein n=1 Tax=Marinobacterium sp. BA1 TaxID=3138931 RepID=UPI0032E544AE
MKIETYDHHKPKDGFVVRTVMPVLMAIFCGTVLLTQLKAAGMFPVSSKDKQWIANQIEQNPNLGLNDSFVNKLRNNGVYFSEGDRDLILIYWAARLRNKSDAD